MTTASNMEKKGPIEMIKHIAVASLVLAAITFAPTVGAQSGQATMPDNLKAPDGSVLHFETFATGTQIYVCTARADDPESFAWSFKAPEAELLDETGAQVGSHYAGPSWEGNDGSKVVGEVVERADAADPGSIPWLLLRAKSHDGSGIFSTTTYIQRLQTAGGVAPTDGCDQSTAGVERAVPYTAVYAFYSGS